MLKVLLFFLLALCVPGIQVYIIHDCKMSRRYRASDIATHDVRPWAACLFMTHMTNEWSPSEVPRTTLDTGNAKVLLSGLKGL